LLYRFASAFTGFTQNSPATGPYQLLKTAKTGGDGGFDYVYPDTAESRFTSLA
jgi:hypothetical protein